MSPVVLRGRSEAMAAALSLMRRVRRSGRSEVLVVTGEAGIGKTSVLRALAAQARTAGFVVGVGNCDEVGRVSPAAPLLDALRAGSSPVLAAARLPELAALAGQPLLLVERLSELLDELAAASPLLIALDDAQWADQVTRFALRALPARLAGSPIVWALATRETAGDPLQGLGLQTADAEVPTQLVALSPLKPSDLSALAEDRLGRLPDEGVRRLLAQIGGNPFFAVQLLDGLTRAAARGDDTAQVPTEFVLAVRGRLAELSAGELELVRIAAVLGRPFELDEAAALLDSGAADTPAPKVTQLLPAVLLAGILEQDRHLIGFRHDLVRETVYGEIGLGRRRVLHRRCCDVLLRMGQGVLAAAPHARAAGEPGDERAADVLVRAAEEAVEAQPDLAAELGLTAFRLLRPAQTAWMPVGRRVVAVLDRGQRWAESVAVIDDILPWLADPEAVGELQISASRALWYAGRLREAVNRIEKTRATGGLTPRVRASLDAVLALVLTGMKPADSLEGVVRDALAAARTSGDEQARVLALNAAGLQAKNAGRHSVALEAFRELRRVAGVSYEVEEILALQLLDRYAEAQVILDAAARDASAAGSPVAPSLLFARMWQNFNQGFVAEAESSARELITASREVGTGVYEMEARMTLVSCALLSDQVPEARLRLASVVERADVDEIVRAPGVALMQGWVLTEEGFPGRAVRVLAPLLAGALDTAHYWPWWPGFMQLFVGIGLAAGDLRFARTALSIAEEGARRNPGIASFEGVALLCRAGVDDDLAAAAAAARTLRGSPRLSLQANSAERYGRLLLKAGRRAEAVEELDRAWDVYARMGAPRPAKNVQQPLRELGVRRAKWTTLSSRPVSGWEALTLAELRVAELIGAGNTNKSAATILGLSTNTIGTHLRAAFSKLGVQSRVQLANALHERR